MERKHYISNAYVLEFKMADAAMLNLDNRLPVFNKWTNHLQS
jgi:hypothetical protein